MLFLANAIMKSPQQALMWSAVLGAVTLVLSPFGLLSGAAIALVTLSAGLMPGVKSLLAALLGGVIMAVFTEHWSGLMLASAEFWLPAFAFAVIYGRTASLSTMVAAATIVALAGVVFAYTYYGSMEIFWSTLMQTMVQAWQDQGVVLEPQAVDLMLEQMPKLLTMLIAMGMLTVWLSMLFLARWWQTQLYEMAPFSASFQQIALGNAFAVGLLLVLLLALFMPEQAMLQDMLGVLVLAFMVQGLAVIHTVAMVKQLNKGWLILVYILLGVLPHMIMLVASLGWLENWINWRSKVTLDSQS